MAEALEREIRDLRALLFSERDPDGRGFAPLADALRRAGDLGQALDVVEGGLERLPDYATGHVVSGWIHRARGDDGEAERSFRRVLELDDENVSALRGLGFLLADGGDVAEALEVFRRLDELDPGDLEVQARLLELGRTATERTDEPGTEEVPGAGGEAAAGAVVPIESLAPEADAAPAGDGDPVVGIADLAPGAGEGEVAPLGGPKRPDAAESGPEVEAVVGRPVMDIADLAPDARGAEAIVDVDDLAPEEVEPAAGPEPAAGGAAVESGTVAEVDGGGAPEPGPEVEAAEGPEAGPVVTGASGAVAEPPDRAARLEAPGEGEGPWTRTMAELYARQGLGDRAVRIYRRLVEASPDDAGLRARLRELEAGAGETTGAARAAEPSPPPPSIPPEVFAEEEDAHLEDLARSMASGPEMAAEPEGPFAWGDVPMPEEGDREAPGSPVSEYFRDLLSWSGDPDADSGGDRGMPSPDGS